MGTKILPVEGQVYTNRNGWRYLCEAVTEDGTATMQRVKDGWTMEAHGFTQLEDGTIEWDFSAGGGWAV